MSYLVGLNKSAFVPVRAINDNIILIYELVRGYERKGISKRCMMKIDINEVYDSLKWNFIEQILSELKFSCQFITCIMQCVTTVTYSMMINEKTTNPFHVRKELDRGVVSCFDNDLLILKD